MDFDDVEARGDSAASGCGEGPGELPNFSDGELARRGIVRKEWDRVGPTACQPPGASGASAAPPSHGTATLALRPACASWMPAMEPWLLMKDVMRESVSMCSVFQMPRSAAVMRPSASTAVASVITRPAPPTARQPRWTTCQSVAKPSSLEY